MLKSLVNKNFALEDEKYASFKKLISGLLPQSQGSEPKNFHVPYSHFLQTLVRALRR